MELRPFTGTYLTDPAATWRELLERDGGVHYAEDLGLWLITRHADVKQALADADGFRNALTLAPGVRGVPGGTGGRHENRRAADDGRR